MVAVGGRVIRGSKQIFKIRDGPRIMRNCKIQHVRDCRLKLKKIQGLIYSTYCFIHIISQKCAL